MKKLIFILAMLSAPVFASDAIDNALKTVGGPGKALHIVGSYALTLTLNAALEMQPVDNPRALSFVIAETIGILKEATDHDPSLADIGRNTLGILAATVFHYSVRW